jgi:hypothetical protein
MNQAALTATLGARIAMLGRRSAQAEVTGHAQAGVA